MESDSFWRNLKDWLKDFWNVLETFGYILIICAIQIQLKFTGENFEYATWLYCYCLCVSYARFTQLFFVFERLGPKIIMIGKMVCCIKRYQFYIWYICPAFYIRAWPWLIITTWRKQEACTLMGSKTLGRYFQTSSNHIPSEAEIQTDQFL